MPTCEDEVDRDLHDGDEEQVFFPPPPALPIAYFFFFSCYLFVGFLFFLFGLVDVRQGKPVGNSSAANKKNVFLTNDTHKERQRIES